MKLQDLLEKRATLTTEMRTIVDSPKGSNRDLDTEQETRFSTLEGEVKTLEKQIERQRTIDNMERRMDGQQITDTGAHDYDQARREFRLIPALAHAAGIQTVDVGKELEVMQEIRNQSGQSFKGIPVPVEIFEQRVQTVGGDASSLVSTDHLGGQYIDKLREAVVVRRMGARVLRSLKGDVSIPRLTTSGTAHWVAENGAISTGDHVFDSVSMGPKHVGAITELSRNTLQQTSPDLEQVVRMDFAKILAAAIDKVALKGGGSNEPTGILGTTAITSAAQSLATLSWANIQAIIGAVEDEDSEGTGWITTPLVVRKCRTTDKVSGSPEHGFIMENRNNLDGYPVAKTNLVPTSGDSPDTHYAIFGKWSDLLIGFWSELDVLVNPYETTAYSKGNVQIRSMLTADVAIRHNESFCVGSDIAI